MLRCWGSQSHQLTDRVQVHLGDSHPKDGRVGNYRNAGLRNSSYLEDGDLMPQPEALSSVTDSLLERDQREAQGKEQKGFQALSSTTPELTLAMSTLKNKNVELIKKTYPPSSAETQGPPPSICATCDRDSERNCLV